jgi:hypothetical protein
MPKRTRRTTSRASATDDRGVGLVGAIAGVTVFLAFVLFAAQLLVNLYATSVVTSATYEAARRAAAAPGGARSATGTAEREARELLGRAGDAAEFTWDLSDPDVVALRVVVDNPRFLWPALDVALGFDRVDRRVRVRVEQVR